MNVTAAVPQHVPEDLVYDYDIFDDKLKDGPHEKLSQLHKTHPDTFFTTANGGHWITTRQNLITAVVTQSEKFSSRQGQIPPIEPPIELLPLTLDPPASTPYRMVLMHHFGPKHIKLLQDAIRAHAEDLFDRLEGRDQFEFVRELGAGLPVGVFMKLMGLPLREFDKFRALVIEYFAPISDERRMELFSEIDLLMCNLIEARIREPGDDLVSKLLNEKIKGRDISVVEIGKLANLLFLGGMDTVANAAAHMFSHLALRGDLQDQLAADPSLIPGFIEESLRMYGVVNSPREVREDIEFDGLQFKKGDMIVAMLSLVGRDDRFVPDAGHFDLKRASHPHMAFGGGPHVCVGQHLARLELKILVEEWFKRYTRFEIAPDFDVKWHTWLIIQLSRLELKITKRAD